jgi:hypothetical protein
LETKAAARRVRKFFSVGCWVRPAASRRSSAAACELALVFEAVGHGDERAVGPAADRREEAARRRLLGRGQRLHPGLDLVFGRARGIEVARLRLGGHAGHERRVVVEARPRALVDQEVVQARAPEGRGVARSCIRSASLPAQDWRTNSGSRIRAASTSRASACRSFAGSLEMSAPIGHRREARGHGLEAGGIGEWRGRLRLFAGSGAGHGDRDQRDGRDPGTRQGVAGHVMSSSRAESARSGIIPLPARRCQRIEAIDLRSSRA